MNPTAIELLEAISPSTGRTESEIAARIAASRQEQVPSEGYECWETLTLLATHGLITATLVVTGDDNPAVQTETQRFWLRTAKGTAMLQDDDTVIVFR